MENTKINFKHQQIYVGIDVHLKQWKVSIHSKEFELKTMSMPPSVKEIVRHLKRNYPGADYYSVYEAGYSGYWIHEQLESNGIHNKIVNPADIPTMDKEKRVKTDRIDCRKLARELKKGGIESIYIRKKEQQEDRLLARTRALMVRKQTRCKNQIKSQLNFFGISIEEEDIKTHWSKNYINWIQKRAKELSMASYSIEALVEELLNLRAIILKLTKQIRAISREVRYKKEVDLLISIPGISVLTAMTILTEIGDINNFSGLDKLLSYIGLVPGEHSSGEKQLRTTMTHRGNKILKNVIIESSWVAVRKDPSLLLSFSNYIKKQRKTKAIIKIARKLVNRIRCVLLNNTEYKLSYIKKCS